LETKLFEIPFIVAAVIVPGSIQVGVAEVVEVPSILFVVGEAKNEVVPLAVCIGIEFALPPDKLEEVVAELAVVAVSAFP
jgi:hypothetical protein